MFLAPPVSAEPVVEWEKSPGGSKDWNMLILLNWRCASLNCRYRSGGIRARKKDFLRDRLIRPGQSLEPLPRFFSSQNRCRPLFIEE
jgi:hypothetical protein